MSDAIFLSASIPDPNRAPTYAATADTVAITAAVSALVHVVLGRRLLVWGGHPAITPMVSVVADDLGLDYGRWVRLYQSLFFEEEFPEDNERFQNITYTDAFQNDRERSLLEMRTRMFAEHEFSSAVFIGGMGGIIDEFELFRKMQPTASLVPVVSTGGAVLDLAGRLHDLGEELYDNLDFVALFHKHLSISEMENRFARPEDQPKDIEKRYWQGRAT